MAAPQKPPQCWIWGQSSQVLLCTLLRELSKGLSLLRSSPPGYLRLLQVGSTLMLSLPISAFSLHPFHECWFCVVSESYSCSPLFFLFGLSRALPTPHSPSLGDLLLSSLHLNTSAQRIWTEPSGNPCQARSKKRYTERYIFRFIWKRPFWLHFFYPFYFLSWN